MWLLQQQLQNQNNNDLKKPLTQSQWKVKSKNNTEVNSRSYISRFEASVKVQSPSIPKSSSCAVLNFVHIARPESYVGCPPRRVIHQ